MTKNTSYLGDLKKTDAIINLLKTSPEGRGHIWKRQLLNNLPAASFRAVKPQIVIGPDGFPYFQLFTPIPGEDFECFVIAHMIPFLLKQGVGVALNPSETAVDWVLTYGEIVNYYLHGEFYSNNDESIKYYGDSVIAQGTDCSDPDEKILPLETRNVLKTFLMNNGIVEPKVAMVLHKENDKLIDLMFNVSGKNFSSEQNFRLFLQQLGWFLPKHYSFGGTEEQGELEHMFPL